MSGSEDHQGNTNRIRASRIPRIRTPTNRREAQHLANKSPESIPPVNDLARRSMQHYSWKKKSKAVLQFAESLEQLNFQELIALKNKITKRDILLLQDESISDLVDTLVNENTTLTDNLNTLRKNINNLLQLGVLVLENRDLILKKLALKENDEKFIQRITTNDLNKAHNKAQEEILTTLHNLREDHTELTDTIELFEELYKMPTEEIQEE